uniref:Reverse transcriptase domain-containing protein n=1 Tax=Xenopus tropicalis TaxID=8364 RepID=A0A803JDT0_XENTR
MLANLLKAHNKRNSIYKIRQPDGSISTNPNIIASTFMTYYQRLYKTTNRIQTSDINSFLKKYAPAPLTPEMKQLIEGDITYEEIQQTIKKLKLNKAPGPDGFSSLYYKKIQEQLTQHLHRLYQHIITGHPLPPEMNEARITVIPKPNKDPLTPKNYRPISLLNTDIKMLATILALRLNKVLTTIIHKDQIGFIPSRQAPDNIRKILNLIIQANKTNTPLCLLALDIEKAFDTLDWQYLFTLLETIGLGSIFIKTLQTYYCTPRAQLNLPTTSPLGYIEIHRGTRQGCPLSPALFALAMEPLARAIRENGDIQGLKVKDKEYKVSLFADDLLLHVTKPLTSLPNLVKILADFAKVSGLTVNPDKSEMLPCNISKHMVKLIEANFGFKIQTDSMQYLGVKLTPNLTTLYKANFPPLIKLLTQDLLAWDKHNISWIGRIHCAKMVVLPKLLYLFRTLPIRIATQDIHNLQSRINNFIWNNKHPRISKQTMYLHKTNGGLSSPNLLKYYWAARMAQITPAHASHNKPLWVEIEDDLIYPYSLQQVLWLRKIPYNCLQHISPLTKEMLQLWQTLRHRHHLISKPSPLTPLINNQDFPPGLSKRTFVWWTNSGVTNLHSLTAHNKPLTTPQILDKFQPPPQEKYRASQLAHFIQQQAKLGDLNIISSTGLETICRQAPLQPGTLSLIYKLINQPPLNNKKLNNMLKWERDLNTTLTTKQWAQCSETANKGSTCVTVRETSIKILHRTYLVPYRLNKLYPTCNPQCYRGCPELGTMLHIWWNCDIVSKFWDSVIHMLSRIFHTQFPKDPLTLLLGKKPPRFTNSGHRLSQHILMAARLIIASNWKKARLPLNSLKTKIICIATNEKLSYMLQNDMEAYDKIWMPWLLHENDPQLFMALRA